MSDRSTARSQALNILYQREITGEAIADILRERSWEVSPISADDVDEIIEFDEPGEFCRTLLSGVEEHQARIDEAIETASEHWTLSRMPLVDRNVLRLAVFELLYQLDIPASVTINEAVDLAKRYGGGTDSSKFVNGVLGRLAEGREDAPSGDDQPNGDSSSEELTTGIDTPTEEG